MDNELRYNKLNRFLKNKFGEKVLKICIDGGFTCPNRDGKKSTYGCIFCSEKGSGEHIKKCDTISEHFKYTFSNVALTLSELISPLYASSNKTSIYSLAYSLILKSSAVSLIPTVSNFFTVSTNSLFSLCKSLL